MGYRACVGSLFTAFVFGLCPLFAGVDWLVLDSNSITNEVNVVDLGTVPLLEAPVLGATYPKSAVITPDATKAILVTSAQDPSPNVLQLDLTTAPISISASAAFDMLFSAALSPDGTTVFVGGEGQILALRTSDLSEVGRVAVGSQTVLFIAVSPNEPRAYGTTTTNNEVHVIDTENFIEMTPISLPGGANASGVAITPDGSELYVGDKYSSNVYYITMSDTSVHTIPLSAGGGRTYGNITVSPDGTSVYVPQASLLTKIDVSSHTVVGEFSYPPQIASIGETVDITPDGKMLCISNLSRPSTSSQYMAFMDTATGVSVFPPLQLSAYSATMDPSSIAITPDGAPTSAFTASISRMTVSCDGESSSSPTGTIAQYQWDFGDGHTATTTSPTISHKYAAGGTYTITLTVTNTAGTSTGKTFTGRMVKNNGGPSAVFLQQVSFPGVVSFKGKVYRKVKRRRVYLKTWWSKILTPRAKKAQIFARKKRVATRKIHKHSKTLRLHPRKFPSLISKKYISYLNRKYTIRVVDTFGRPSRSTHIRVKS